MHGPRHANSGENRAVLPLRGAEKVSQMQLHQPSAPQKCGLTILLECGILHSNNMGAH